jgi:hypothetical protein
MIFRSVVTSVLTSGLVVFVLNKGAFDKLAKCYYKMLKSLCAGEAVTKTNQADGTIRYIALTRSQICKHLHIVSLSAIRFLQNRANQQTLCGLAGEGAIKQMRKMRVDGHLRVSANARYLGPHLNWRGLSFFEAGRRVRAAWASFSMYSKLSAFYH